MTQADDENGPCRASGPVMVHPYGQYRVRAYCSHVKHVNCARSVMSLMLLRSRCSESARSLTHTCVALNWSTLNCGASVSVRSTLNLVLVDILGCFLLQVYMVFNVDDCCFIICEYLINCKWFRD